MSTAKDITIRHRMFIHMPLIIRQGTNSISRSIYINILWTLNQRKTTGQHRRDKVLTFPDTAYNNSVIHR